MDVSQADVYRIAHAVAPLWFGATVGAVKLFADSVTETFITWARNRRAHKVVGLIRVD